MMPSKKATTTITFGGRQQKNQQQQKTREERLTVVRMKALDHHIERLEAKLSYLIRSYDDSHTDLLYQYDKKIATVKQEINDARDLWH
jgi:predicted RNase H-like nuclease (RuvC/YqgF family)